MTIDRASPISMYVQLADALRQRIVQSGIQIGERLPTVRALIAEYRVSLPVVRQALDLLQREGVLLSEQGKGTFITRIPVLKIGDPATTVLFLAIARASTDPFFAHVLTGFERAAAAAGMGVLFSQSVVDTAQALTVIRSRAAAGVVLSGDVPAELVAALRNAGTPFVCAGIPLQPNAPTDIPWVANDDAAGAYQAVQHLLAMGHRRIGCVGGDPLSFFWGERLRGYTQALAHAGIAADPQLHACAAADDSERGALAFATLLAMAKPPSAVFAGNDRFARGGYRVARERGLRIPQDLAIVGFDDLDFSVELDPPLTTIHAERERLGETAYRLLAEAIAGIPPRQVTLPVRLVARASVAPRR